MNFTLFLGCNIPARVPQYRDAALAVCRHLDIRVEMPDEFMCCGYPARNMDEFVFLVCAARNLALAETWGRDLMVLCKCCFGSLRAASSHLKDNPGLKQAVNRVLAREGLVYKGDLQIRHFLSVLHEDVGVKQLRKAVQNRYEKLNIAASVGCHALRPAKITGFDNPAVPALFDDLVSLTGARAVAWSAKSDCCGAPLVGINDRLARQIMKRKLANARANQADFIAVACPYSFIQFDTMQAQLVRTERDWQTLAPVLYPQLLGLAMGIDAADLGFDAGRIPATSLESFLSQEMSHA